MLATSSRTSVMLAMRFEARFVFRERQKLSISCRRHQSGGQHRPPSNKKKLSRKEHRRQCREAAERKKAEAWKKKAPEAAVVEDASGWQSLLDFLGRSFLPCPPRLPGGSRQAFDKEHNTQLLIRFSIATVLFLLASHEDISPYVIDMAQGPSMLPTFMPLGDLDLRETGAWCRFLGIERKYQKGDLIVFCDETGRYAGKRIVGLAGDAVLKHGQFVHLYLDRPDWGIATGQTVVSGNTDNNKVAQDEVRDARQEIIVPDKHVYLEGDFPPFSIDSRQYGAIPVDWIRGRILMRLWPWNRSIWLSATKPEPISVEEALSSGKYNLHVKPR